MSRAARTIRYFAIYLACIGIVLLVVPNVLLGVFGFPATQEVWIRVLGVVVFNLGIYYWFAAVSESTAFFKASVYTRAFVFVAFLAFVLNSERAGSLYLIQSGTWGPTSSKNLSACPGNLMQ